MSCEQQGRILGGVLAECRANKRLTALAANKSSPLYGLCSIMYAVSAPSQLVANKRLTALAANKSSPLYGLCSIMYAVSAPSQLVACISITP